MWMPVLVLLPMIVLLYLASRIPKVSLREALLLLVVVLVVCLLDLIRAQIRRRRYGPTRTFSGV